MTARLIRKPPTNKAFAERFMVELPGFQPLKYKMEQGFLSKYYLLHEHGIYHAGMTHMYIELLDPHGHPLEFFRDKHGAELRIGEYKLVIDEPYPCAADDYDRHYDRRYSSGLRPVF